VDLCIFNKWNYACLAKWVMQVESDMQVKYMFKCKLKVICKLCMLMQVYGWLCKSYICLNARFMWYASYACLCEYMNAYARYVYA